MKMNMNIIKRRKPHRPCGKKTVLCFFLFLLICIDTRSQGIYEFENAPISAYEEVIYFNLDAGDVIVTPEWYTGYEYNSSGEPVQHSYPGHAQTLVYIYQARPGTIWNPTTPGTTPPTIPAYPPVTTTSGATGADAVNLVGVTDVTGIITGWDAKVAANNSSVTEDYRRYPTTHRIQVSIKNITNICLDNVWTTYQVKDAYRQTGGLSFHPQEIGEGYEDHYSRLNLYLKGDNRMGNIFYSSSRIVESTTYEFNNSHLIFRSADGPGEISGTLTVADFESNSSNNQYNSVIGGSDHNGENSKGIDFVGGTVFAGATSGDACTAIGGGGNGTGKITISGGQVTAICNSTGTALGGGMSVNNQGGDGEVEISGGLVYAYNLGTALGFSIGGGSTNSNPSKATPSPGGNGTFTMTGGELHTGTIGGGANNANSSGKYFGKCNITLSGGYVEGKFYMWGSSSGGGESVHGGGGGTITISGGNLSSPTGDNADKVYSKYSANVNGGAVRLSYSTSNGGTFNMSGGSITASTPQNAAGKGGAICIDGTGTFNMTGGTISGCTSPTTGGGIYLAQGTINLNGGSIVNNSSTTNGGGIYFYSGTINVGAESNAVTVKSNVANSTADDIYLCSGKYLTVVGNGFNAQDVGIYTQSTNTDVGVLYNSSGSYLSDLYSDIAAKSKNVFPNRTDYTVKPYSAGNYIYFTKSISPWSSGPDGQQSVNALPTQVGGIYQIGSVKDLTAFLWYVNDIDTHYNFDGSAHPEAQGKLVADIDMSGHYWVPIANYTGTFDGNGHTISNIVMDRNNISTERGFFGTVATGGVIKNLQLHNCNFKSGQASYIGLVASQMAGGTISNCSVNGYLEATSQPVVAGGLVGLVGGGEVHSSCAVPTLTAGSTMGGLVGEVAASGSLRNSFANATISGDATKGGLVGSNGGTVENCYVRGSDNLVGAGSTGTVDYCYSSTGTPSGTNGIFAITETPYLYKHADNQVTVEEGFGNDFVANGTIGNDREMQGLLATLNNWVRQDAAHQSTYTSWMRTCASPVNGDYPLLEYDGYDCVAQKTGSATLEYGKVFDDKFGEYISGNTGSIYLYKTPSALSGGYNVNHSNDGTSTQLYIGENVALKSNNNVIKAHVGITLDNSAGTTGANPTFGGGYVDAIDWHMFSPALSDAPLGITYDGVEYKYNQNDDLPKYEFTNANGYFPTNVYTGSYASDYYPDWDFYAYYEPDYHWINFKRNGNSHWHEDLWPGEPEANRPKINYKSNGTGADWSNESTLIPGRGYLVSTAQPTFLQAYGTLNKGIVLVPLTMQGLYRTGHNFLGNPYQSYLDFDQFAETNKFIWGGDIRNAAYIILDEDLGDYVYYAYDQSVNSFSGNRYLHPHQGFMVVTQTVDKIAKFEETMADLTADVAFRGGHVNYPLVNLIVFDANANRDMVTVELGRPQKGGARKVQDLRSGNGSIWCHYEDEDYGIVFTQPDLVEANIRFATDEDCAYTMTWNTQNGEFSYLHLIDNMTGTDIDCLTTEEYKFNSRTSDYKSRFRLVFDYTGVEENGEDGPSTSSETSAFAFPMGDELVVNGAGHLEMIDLLGRIVKTEELHGNQNTVSIPSGTVGVYVLRLENGNGTQVQKIVVK